MTHSLLSVAMSGNFIGFLLAICGNTLIACSLTLQKRAHNVVSSAAAASHADDPEAASTSAAPEHLDHPHHHHHVEQPPPPPAPAPAPARSPSPLPPRSLPPPPTLPPSLTDDRDDDTDHDDERHHEHHEHHQHYQHQHQHQRQHHNQNHNHHQQQQAAPAPSSPRAPLVVVDIHSPPSSPNGSRRALLSPPSPPSQGSPSLLSLPSPSPPSPSAVHAAASPSARARGRAASLAFLRSPVWWAGTLLMALGEAGNFAAFAFAPASLVAPLGAWSVVLSALLAHVFLREAISSANAAGIALCVAGAVLIGTSAPDAAAAHARLDAAAVMRLLVRAPFVLYILVSLSVAGALIVAAHRTALARRHVCVYVGVSSVLGSVTVVCAKALATFVRLTLEGASQFGSWLPFALAATLACAVLLQLRYLNMAMARFGNAQVIPVYYVLFTSCALMSGVVMYREFDELSLRNVPFFLGICATMTGVFLVARSADPEDAAPVPSADPEQANWQPRAPAARKRPWTSSSLFSVDTEEQSMQEHLNIIKFREVDEEGFSSPLSSPRSSHVAL